MDPSIIKFLKGMVILGKILNLLKILILLIIVGIIIWLLKVNFI